MTGEDKRRETWIELETQDGNNLLRTLQMAEAPLLRTFVKVLIFRTRIYCKLFGHKTRDLSPHPYLFNCVWSDLTQVYH